MRKQPTVAEERRHLAYAEDALAGKHGPLSEQRRAVLEFKVKTITARLAGKCMDCGRKLTDPVSLERGYGPECAMKHKAVA